MHKTIEENTAFLIEVLEAGPCRMGWEPGARFFCEYECPAGFCPKTTAALHTLCECVRAGGDLRLLGGSAAGTMYFCCADGVVRFRLTGWKKP